jgi:hypothetical protein
MNKSGDWTNPEEYPLPPNPDVSGIPQDMPSQGYGAPPGYSQEVQPRGRRRSKWLAGILAFLIPGIGHMYLGLMVKGIILMLLLALNITAIVYVSIEVENVLSIVLLSLFLPIIYFYNLFDALQSTDVVNERRTSANTNHPAGWATRPLAKSAAEEGISRGVPPVGILFLAAAGIVILVMADISWTHWLFDSWGSMLGAVVLIGAGVGLWFWEMRGHPHSK